MGRDGRVWADQASLAGLGVSAHTGENCAVGIKDQIRIQLTLKAIRGTNKKGSKNRQILERSQSYNVKKKKKTMPYAELQKIHLTSVNEIQKSAKLIYNLFKVKSADKDKKDLGIPRPIFTSLVNQIVLEETPAILASTNRDEHNLGHRDALHPNSKISIRPKSAPAANRLEDFLKQPRMIMQNTDEFHDDKLMNELIRPKSAVAIKQTVTSSTAGFVEKLRRRKLSVLEDADIIKVRDRKMYLQRERERQIMYNINKKFHLDVEANAHWQRQKSWLAIVYSIKFMAPQFPQIHQHRIQSDMRKRYRKEVRAVLLISRWWSKIKIRRKFKKDIKLLFFLRFFVVRTNALLKLRERRRAVLLIRQFVADSSSGSKRVLAIYNFRKNCISVQRWFRSWLQIKHDRIRSLWLAMEKIIKRRHDEAVKQARIDEINALKAISAMEGFDKTLDQLNLMHKKINQLVQKEQRIMKSVIRSQRQEDKILSELVKFKGTQKVEEVVVEVVKKEKRGKGKSWYQRKVEDKDAIVRITILSEILKQQRRRHIRKEEVELRRSKKIKMVYDLNEVKEFLLTDTTSVPIAQKVEGHKRKLFLLLSQGGIDQLEGISNFDTHPNQMMIRESSSII